MIAATKSLVDEGIWRNASHPLKSQLSGLSNKRCSHAPGSSAAMVNKPTSGLEADLHIDFNTYLKLQKVSG